MIILGLVINPYSLSWFFSNDGKITSWIVYSTIIILQLALVLFGVAIFNSRENKLFPKMGLAVVSTLFTVLLLIGSDRFYGEFLMPDTAQLLFPPFSQAEHNTSEFELDVKINNLGFRGANTTIKKTKKRVLLIGDSFTFGWGVELQETWRSILANQHPEIEFLNLGQGGNHPGDYVRVAKNAIPLLKPDLIIVCVLQGNDVHQLMRVIEHENELKKVEPAAFEEESSINMLRRYLSIAMPNFTKRFPAKASIEKRWFKEAKKLRTEFTEEQSTKYQKLPKHIKSQFEKGQLNPSLIYESMHHPNLFLEAVDTSSTLRQKALIRLRDHLFEITALGTTYSTKTIVAYLPNRPYSFPSELNALTKLGFNVEGLDKINENFSTELALSEVKAPQVYPSIKGDSLFYRYDGHWNANGNRIFARELINELNNLPEWKHFLTSSNF